MTVFYAIINHTILSNQHNEKIINTIHMTDVQLDMQGNILSECINLIEFDMNFAHTSVENFFYLI